MRKCFNCDKEFDESVDFCPTCGAKLGGNAADEMQPEPAPEMQPEPAPEMQTEPQTNASAGTAPEVLAAPVSSSAQNNEPVTVGEWMILLVNLIPCVGPLVYFIIMLVWAFSDNIKASKKTFAKANLIIWLVSIGLGVVVFLIMLIAGVGFSAISGAMSDIY